MSRDTSIAWCHSSVNPTMGCSGCELWKKGVGGTCYALNMLKRYAGRPGMPAGPEEVTLYYGRMREALRWGAPNAREVALKPYLPADRRFLFVDDMGDLFDHHVPFKFIAEEVVEPLGKAEGTLGILLTKQAQRMAEFVRWYRAEYGALPENALWGVSVTKALSLRRLVCLLGVEGIDVWVSAEPLLGPIHEMLREVVAEYPGRVKWMASGSESGAGFRPMEMDWQRGLRDVCAEFEVPYFFKQTTEASGAKSERPYLDGVQHLGVPVMEGAVH